MTTALALPISYYSIFPITSMLDAMNHHLFLENHTDNETADGWYYRLHNYTFLGYMSGAITYEQCLDHWRNIEKMRDFMRSIERNNRERGM